MALIEIAPPALSLPQRIEFFRTLGSWLNSGGGTMSIAESVKFTCETFGRDEYRHFANRMDRIVREVQSGQTPFYKAINVAMLGFTEQEISIIEAAEQSNQLRVAVPSLVEAMTTRSSAQKSLASKLAMPLIGGIMLIFMSIMVMTVMMPTVLGPVLKRRADALDDMPFIIAWFWDASQWLQVWWLHLTITLIVFILILVFRNHPVLKPHTEDLFMKLKPYKRLVIAFNATLVVYFMPALLRSGMSPHAVLRTLSSSIGNLQIKGSLRVAASEHESGAQLGDALKVLPFKSSFRSAVEAGEKTGKVAERVEDLKIPYSDDLDRVIRQTVLSLTFIVMALLLPFFLISMYITLTVPIFALMEY